ncbi:unnamed protein product [Eruca vesicaria subsp. sativa]|uniref:Replication factor A C-terminal domain-containing protein n=1 Tax=Eruca vesicaria subsp. sativa TaxID=29727 RepID=A0ABC8M1U4_ERUVS|nr:unnamed protein product [Eruca vesicaria subsp. sativa]
MNSTGKAIVSGDLKINPDVSAPESIKQTGERSVVLINQPGEKGVSSSKDVSGESMSRKLKGKACTAIIDDVVHGSAWYYIACGNCKTKATKGPTTLMCKKCGKAEVSGVAKYLERIYVYDNSDQASFANESTGDDHVVPVPQALVATIGQTRKFIIKVSDHNLTGKSQALIVTKVLPLEVPEPEGDLEENLGQESGDEGEESGNEPGQLLEGRLYHRKQPTTSRSLTEGDSYELSGFSVLTNNRERKLTKLLYYIQIDQETTMSNVTITGSLFPGYSLSPQSYNCLLRLATTPSYLPAVVGQILIMHEMKPNNPESTRKFTIGLMLNNSKLVKLMLWDKPAGEFSILQSREDRKFKVIIITSIITKVFQGN